MATATKKAKSEATISDDPQESLNSIAREVVMEFPDPERAREALAKAVRSRPTLYNSLRERLEQSAFATAVYTARHSLLHSIKQGAPKGTRRGIACLDSVARALEDAMLDWMLPGTGGKLLGDLTGAELDPQIQREHDQVIGHQKNESFFRELRQRTPDEQIVRKCVKVAEARALWRKIAGK